MPAAHVFDIEFKIGCTAETLRKWVRRSETDSRENDQE